MAKITGGNTLSNIKKSKMAPTTVGMGRGYGGSKGVNTAGAEIADIDLGTLANMDIKGAIRGSVDMSPGSPRTTTRGAGVSVLTPTNEYLKFFNLDIEQIINEDGPRSYALSAVLQSKPMSSGALKGSTLQGKMRMEDGSLSNIGLEANIPLGK
jgi:hypothetical protein